MHRSPPPHARLSKQHPCKQHPCLQHASCFDYPLQVFTACANAFAHGSNEVANAVGPLAAIWQVWQTGAITSKAPIPVWLLAIGGMGICVGLATCEWR
jgi:phosphate/sulfate permease